MPLDPTAVPIVDILSKVFPDVGGAVLDAVEARRILRESPIPRPEPPAVAGVEDRIVAGSIPARMYWPLGGGASPAPLVVFLHGGGWVLCDLDTHDIPCRNLANATGSVVVSVDYRLAPEHRFPAAIDDAYAALAWAHEHAGELGADPARLAVAGDSAGGNLAAAVALAARDRGGPALRYQLLIYPVLDHDFDRPSYQENAVGNFLTAVHMQWYWDQYVPDVDARDNPLASPMRAPELRGLPPAYVITAECDVLRDEGNAYAARLRDAGVPVTLSCAPGMFHGFFGTGDVIPIAKAENDKAFAALRAALA
jgi:acetyl esterase